MQLLDAVVAMGPGYYVNTDAVAGWIFSVNERGVPFAIRYHPTRTPREPLN